ncbi:MAG: MlaD family protein [Fibrobacterota bacterium]
MRINREKQAGYIVFTLAAVLCLWIFSVFIFTEVFHGDTLYIRFPQTGNLRIDDTVTVRGRGYGVVQDFQITDNQSSTVTVDLFRPIKIRTGYTAFVEDRGIFGKRAVNIINGPPSEKVLSPDDTLQGLYYDGIMDILGEIHKFQDAYISLRTTIENLYAASTNEDTLNQNFAEGIRNIDGILDTFVKNIILFRRKLGQSVPAVEEKTASVDRKLRKAEKLLTDAETVSNTHIPRARQALEDISELLDNSVSPAVSRLNNALITLNEDADTEELSDALKDVIYSLEEAQHTALRLRLIIRCYRGE